MIQYLGQKFREYQIFFLFFFYIKLANMYYSVFAHSARALSVLRGEIATRESVQSFRNHRVDMTQSKYAKIYMQNWTQLFRNQIIRKMQILSYLWYFRYLSSFTVQCSIKIWESTLGKSHYLYNYAYWQSFRNHRVDMTQSIFPHLQFNVQ